MKILLTAIREKDSANFIFKEFTIIGTDCLDLNPARYFVDQFYKVPAYHDESYIPSFTCHMRKRSCKYFNSFI